MKNRCNRILSVLLCVLFLCGSVPVATATDILPEGFTGIYTIEDLYAIRYALSNDYILMADLDLTEATASGGDWDNGYGWVPIGEDSAIPFTGTFDGNGHTITGLQISSIRTTYAGLFGYVQGSIHDLTISNATITTSDATGYCGALVGFIAEGVVNNIVASGLSILSYGQYTGGIVGYASNMQIEDCYADGTIQTSYSNEDVYTGGIVGLFSGAGNILRCSNRASVYSSTSHSRYVGNSDSYVLAYTYAGGIAGNATDDSTIQLSYNTGCISARANAQNTYRVGYMGQAYYGHAHAYSFAGGICGSAECAYLSNCYNSGEIQSTATGSYYDVTFERTAYASGICGKGNVHQSINLGKVSGEGKYVYESAIAYGSLQSCYYLRDAAATGRFGVTDTATAAIALSQAQLKLQTMFGYLNFETIWFVDPSSNIEHPQLIANPERIIHVHSYYAEVTAPTCSEKGYTSFTCSGCGDCYIADQVEALGHEFSEWETTKVATCTEKGEKTRGCSRCDVTETEEISALGHDFSEWSVTTAATCTESGEESRSCSRCEVTESREIMAQGHDYTFVVAESTCTESGYTSISGMRTASTDCPIVRCGSVCESASYWNSIRMTLFLLME